MPHYDAFVADHAHRVGYRLIETREADKLLSALVQIAGDNAPESRYYGRRAVSVLLAHPDFGKLSGKLLADAPGHAQADCGHDQHQRHRRASSGHRQDGRARTGAIDGGGLASPQDRQVGPWLGITGRLTCCRAA